MNDPINEVWREVQQSSALLKQAEDLLAATRKSISEMAISAERAAEERRKQLLAAEESLRIARQGLACLGSNPEAVATLAGAISALADSVEAILSAMKASE